MTRRALLWSAAGLAACAAAPAASHWNGGMAAADPALDPALRERALLALARHNGSLWSRDAIAVVDFGQPSAAPRLHLVDILAGTTDRMLVAHGRGSDPEHSGSLQSFSNEPGSLATSRGAYLTGDAYVGIHGPSRRLLGLDPTNSNAEERAIVIHSAWYVGEDIIARQGKLGRSDGCFAVSPADIGTLLARLGKGRLLYADRIERPSGEAS